jgi:hypothetical protein
MQRGRFLELTGLARESYFSNSRNMFRIVLLDIPCCITQKRARVSAHAEPSGRIAGNEDQRQ